MGLRRLKNKYFYSYSAEIDFRRQNIDVRLWRLKSILALSGLREPKHVWTQHFVKYNLQRLSFVSRLVSVPDLSWSGNLVWDGTGFVYPGVTVVCITDRQTDILLTEKKSHYRLICHRNERDICTCIYKIVSLLKSYDNIHGMTYTTKIMLSGIAKIKTGYFDNINDYY